MNTYMGENVTTKFQINQKNLAHVVVILQAYNVEAEFLITGADGGFVVELREELCLPLFRLLTAFSRVA